MNNEYVVLIFYNIMYAYYSTRYVKYDDVIICENCTFSTA